ncbi:hypothetical protein AVEN_211523-1 [Araneus ventricosus]|uniref:Uncharacterized protein n=1 Tax=Araneus ventricosus TaxID=182803 RepID=A0A4Y2PFS4_ARAVE|nr:hypothetical protein AVEN_211523-1 [Araneus ventricosus]
MGRRSTPEHSAPSYVHPTGTVAVMTSATGVAWDGVRLEHSAPTPCPFNWHIAVRHQEQGHGDGVLAPEHSALSYVHPTGTVAVMASGTVEQGTAFFLEHSAPSYVHPTATVAVMASGMRSMGRRSAQNTVRRPMSIQLAQLSVMASEQGHGTAFYLEHSAPSHVHPTGHSCCNGIREQEHGTAFCLEHAYRPTSIQLAQLPYIRNCIRGRVLSRTQCTVPCPSNCYSCCNGIREQSTGRRSCPEHSAPS